VRSSEVLTLQPHGVNLQHKVLGLLDTAVYSDAVNIGMSHGSVV
jgi:hypothetical protein